MIKLIFELSPETKIISIFSTIWIVGVICGLPINMPDAGSLSFTEKHYFRPLIIAFVFQTVVGLKGGLSLHKRGQARQLLMLVPLMVLSVFFHFNFKAWMPFINHNSYDFFYNEIDSNLVAIVENFIKIRYFLTSSIGADFDFLYHGLFVAMFFVSFCVHAILDEIVHLRRLVMSVCLILLVGGLSYWIAPAEGAYLYRVGENLQSSIAQQHMHFLFNQVKATGVLPNGYFVAPPAAMPSLHIAHAFTFLWFAWRRIPWLAWLYLPVTFWLVIESVCSAFHYLVDLPVGGILAAVCIVFATRLLPEERAKELSDGE